MKLNLAVSGLLVALARFDVSSAFRSHSFQTERFQKNTFTSSILSVAAVAPDQIDEQSTIATYHDVNELTFRELQTECKNKGLKATGNTRVLRIRLLEDLGLCESDEECSVLVSSKIFFFFI